MTLQSEKDRLRAEAVETRARAAALNPLAGWTLAARLPREALPEPGTLAALYWPFRTEIDPRPLMRRLRLSGVGIALPKTPAKGSEDPLSFRLWAEGLALSRSAFGVEEPSSEAEPVEPGRLFVPLLAFDRRGGRLGYGAGHYDRTLEAIRGKGPVQAIGLAFAAQEIDQAPAGPHDQRLDAILTEREFIAAC
jgi:5-formyltetrahydrofolate cyclo-ligase